MPSPNLNCSLSSLQISATVCSLLAFRESLIVHSVPPQASVGPLHYCPREKFIPSRSSVDFVQGCRSEARGVDDRRGTSSIALKGSRPRPQALQSRPSAFNTVVDTFHGFSAQEFGTPY